MLVLGVFSGLPFLPHCHLCLTPYIAIPAFLALSCVVVHSQRIAIGKQISVWFCSMVRPSPCCSPTRGNHPQGEGLWRCQDTCCQSAL